MTPLISAHRSLFYLQFTAGRSQNCQRLILVLVTVGMNSLVYFQVCPNSSKGQDKTIYKGKNYFSYSHAFSTYSDACVRIDWPGFTVMSQKMLLIGVLSCLLGSCLVTVIPFGS